MLTDKRGFPYLVRRALSLLAAITMLATLACGKRQGTVAVTNASTESINRIMLMQATGATTEQHFLAAGASVEMVFTITADSEFTLAVTFDSGRQISSASQSIAGDSANRFRATITGTTVEVTRDAASAAP